ncbi:MAG: 50S ribosomal protein L24 [Methermicoccaceae archaeon]
MFKSSKPSKQRKFRATASHHRRRKFLAAHLSSELREEHGRRSLPVKTGDTVKVVRGDFSDTEAKVGGVHCGSGTILVDGVSVMKADGTEVPRPIHPSNVIITKLDLSDERRLGEIK